MMTLDSPQHVRRLYRKRARRYDLAIRLFRLAGLDIEAHRRAAVSALHLEAGGQVVDIACGTGLNLPFLRAAVGDTGRVIGVDLTDAMLEVARRRVARHGWRNVELIEANAAEYEFPPGLDGVISTLAITLIPEYDDIIRRGALALKPGGRLVIFEMKEPESWPRWLLRFAVWLNRPYGVRLDQATRHPWESVRRYLREEEFHELFFGALYISVGRSVGV